MNAVEKTRFLCAANQIGKSTTLIRYNITIATHPNGYRNDDNGLNIPSWQEMWKDWHFSLGEGPVIWYLYPDGNTIKIEFETKWLKYLPKGDFKNHPKYGWRVEYGQRRTPFALYFNSGAKIFFRSYSQKESNIQSTSVHIINTDEELTPAALYDELVARTFATRGYFFMVFTATQGQIEWEKAMAIGSPIETFKDAWKRNVSMYDCLSYSDGSPTDWNIERIIENKNKCKSDAEIQRRIYGKFVVDSGLVYPSFKYERNVIKPVQVPQDWIKFVGIDIGSGGKNHKAAIVFVAVRPDFRLAYVYRGWRGDGAETTMADILDKFIELKGKEFIHYIYYDYAARDFFNIAMSKGIPVKRANKSHESGEHLLNSLFKNKMLYILETPELIKLADELKRFKMNQKRKKGDDMIDALRYAVADITFDFSKIDKTKEIKIETDEREEKLVRKDLYDIDELEEWNKYYDVF